jgi:hypothetical protein
VSKKEEEVCQSGERRVRQRVRRMGTSESEERERSK